MNKVLILDDDQQIVKMASLVLTKQGYKVFTANSGEDAISTLVSNQVDILLTDILMPNVDGIEVINACRKEKIAVKIIAMSGGRRKISAEFNLKSAQMLGANQVLVKPFSQAQLLSAMAHS